MQQNVNQGLLTCLEQLLRNLIWLRNSLFSRVLKSGSQSWSFTQNLPSSLEIPAPKPEPKISHSANLEQSQNGSSKATMHAGILIPTNLQSKANTQANPVHMPQRADDDTADERYAFQLSARLLSHAPGVSLMLRRALPSAGVM